MFVLSNTRLHGIVNSILKTGLAFLRQKAKIITAVYTGIAFNGKKTKVMICNVSSPLNLQDIQYIVFL
ncbi:hypothetical protein DD829_21210 [Chryseobacterium sp. HMWF035]|nr:hypothetical protein DBR25_11575 [Chryseobacterium sp. HMWF001]PVV50725.1 hypothetical protein DD829_21210 [Chryseobacterium sp. HMWF035]